MALPGAELGEAYRNGIKIRAPNETINREEIPDSFYNCQVQSDRHTRSLHVVLNQHPKIRADQRFMIRLIYNSNLEEVYALLEKAPGIRIVDDRALSIENGADRPPMPRGARVGAGAMDHERVVAQEVAGGGGPESLSQRKARGARQDAVDPPE